MMLLQLTTQLNWLHFKRLFLTISSFEIFKIDIIPQYGRFLGQILVLEILLQLVVLREKSNFSLYFIYYVKKLGVYLERSCSKWMERNCRTYLSWIFCEQCDMGALGVWIEISCLQFWWIYFIYIKKRFHFKSSLE